MADVFISYKRSDRDRIEPIAAGLQSLGFSVWYDARLDAGSAFDEEITRELRAARCVVVCWSKDSVQSEWVRAEATEGRKRGALVSCLLEACDPYPPFNLVHHEDLTSWRGGDKDPAWVRLRDVIGRRVRGEGGSTELASAKPNLQRPKWLIPGAIATALLGIGFVVSPSGPVGQQLFNAASQANAKRLEALDSAISDLTARYITLEPALDPMQQIAMRADLNNLGALYSPLRFKVMGEFAIAKAEWEAPDRAVEALREKIAAAEKRALSGGRSPAPAPDETPPAAAPAPAKPEPAKSEPAKSEPAQPSAPAFKVAERELVAKFAFPDSDSAAIPVAASREIDAVLRGVGGGQLTRVIVTGYYPKPDDGSGEALAGLNRRRVALLRDNLLARGVASDLIITDERSEPPTYQGTRAELFVTFNPE